MSEYQTGSSIDKIRGDHVNRYKQAASFVSGAVLDAGCGCGYGSSILARNGSKVIAMDKNEKAIAYAKKHYSNPRIRFYKGDITDHLFFPGVDFIIAFEVVEHVERPDLLLKTFAQASGQLIMSVPNQENRPYTKKQFPYHYRHFTPTEIEDFLYNAGWKKQAFYHQKDLSPGKISTGTGGLTLIIMAQK